MKQDVKTKVRGILLAIFFALIAFICLVVLNNKMSDNNKVDLVIAAKTIPKNTLITEDNVGEYFTTIQAQEIFKTPHAVTNTNELIGQYALNGIWDKTPINQDMFQSQFDIFAAYKKPVQASFNVANLSDAVCGRLRAGDYVDIFGVDAVRYYVLHEIPYDNDGSITWDLLVERINSDLANILGNLVNRTIAMTNKYFDGIVTNPHIDEEIDNELKDIALAMPHKVQTLMDEFKASKALDEIFVLLRRTNKYIDDTMPWALAKDETKKERLATVLYNLIEAIRFAAIALEPYMPSTSTKILDQINTDQRQMKDLTTFGLYKEGTKVTDKPQQLFARLDPKEVEKKVNDLQPKKEKPQVDENLISIDDFAKVELVVGTVEKCEKHPSADRLLVSQINIGKETRQIVSGIAEHYSPDDMIGKKVIVVANLKPAMLRGVESQGMILAGSKKKLLEVISVETLPNGTKIR